MIKLERDRMQKAIDRSKQLRPFVKMTGFRQYQVSGSKGNTYTVHFTVGKDAKGNPVRMGECTCPAGQHEMMCYHIAAAAAVHVAIQAMRQGAAKAAPVAADQGIHSPAVTTAATADPRASLIETVKSLWHRARPFAAINESIRQVFGVTRLELLADDSLMQIAAALRA